MSHEGCDVMLRFLSLCEGKVLLRYDCHTNYGQNMKSGDSFFSAPPGGGGWIGVCFPNLRAPLLQLLQPLNTTVCGREMNRPSELCTVGGTYQQRRHVAARLVQKKREYRRNDSV